jgi:hypothetical protein
MMGSAVRLHSSTRLERRYLSPEVTERRALLAVEKDV